MNKVPKVLTTGNNLADKMVEKALWKVLQTMMVTPQGKLLGIAAEKVYPYMEDVGHYTAQGISAFNEVCSNKK